MAEGQFTENAPPTYGPADLRFTTRDDRLYVIAVGGAEDGRIHVRSLARDLTLYSHEIGTVHLLGHPEPLEYEHTAQALTVRLPENTPIGPLPVLRIAPAAP